MRFISHRGNIAGRRSDRENSFEYIDEALAEGYDVEVDIWFVDGVFYLGHDGPEHQIKNTSEDGILFDERIWFHCKNIETLEVFCRELKHANFFFHQKDDYTLTSQNWIWAYPGMPVNNKCIAVLPEDERDAIESTLANAGGICSDIIEKYRSRFLK